MKGKMKGERSVEDKKGRDKIGVDSISKLKEKSN